MTQSSLQRPTITIVGGGLAGLSAALKLESYGYRPLLFEASDTVGGRIRTLHQNGALLDVGFQALLTSYREVPAVCKNALNLRSFRPGAYCRKEDRWSHFSPFSPWNWDQETPRGLYALGKALMKSGIQELDSDTETMIHSIGAPEEWVNDFLAPFLRGIFLDKHLEVRASRCLQLLPLFIWGRAALPEKGMWELPRWFAKQLKATEIRVNTPVVEASPHHVTLFSGHKISSDAVLIALSQPQLGKLITTLPECQSRTTACDYFLIDQNKVKATPYLWLDGRVESPVNNFAFLNAVQPTYAPKGKHLLSATSMGELFPSTATIQRYLEEELKLKSEDMLPLERQLVTHALPTQATNPPFETREMDGIFIAGEAVDPPSINDAISSGKKAARLIHQSLSE